MSDNVRTYTSKERNMYLLGLAGQNMIYNIRFIILSVPDYISIFSR